MRYLIAICQPVVLCLLREGRQEPAPTHHRGRQGGTRAARRSRARREGSPHSRDGGSEAPQVWPPRLPLQPGRVARVEAPLRSGGGTDPDGASARGGHRPGGCGSTTVPTVSTRSRPAGAAGGEAGSAGRSARTQPAGGVPAGPSCGPGGPSRAKGTARATPRLSASRTGSRPRQGKAHCGRVIYGGWWPTGARCSTWGLGSSGWWTRGERRGPRPAW
jgi:hypothetical protein